MNKKRWFVLAFVLLFAGMTANGAYAQTDSMAVGTATIEAGSRDAAITDILIEESVANALAAAEDNPGLGVHILDQFDDVCASYGGYLFDVTITTPGVTWNYKPANQPGVVTWVPGENGYIDSALDDFAYSPLDDHNLFAFLSDNNTPTLSGGPNSVQIFNGDGFTAEPVCDFFDIAEFAEVSVFTASDPSYCLCSNAGHPVAVRNGESLATMDVDSGYTSKFDVVVQGIDSARKTLTVAVIRRSLDANGGPGAIVIPGDVFTVNTQGLFSLEDTIPLEVAIQGFSRDFALSNPGITEEVIQVATILPLNAPLTIGGSDAGPDVTATIPADTECFNLLLDASPAMDIASGRLYLAVAIPTDETVVEPGDNDTDPILLGDLFFFRPAAVDPSSSTIYELAGMFMDNSRIFFDFALDAYYKAGVLDDDAADLLFLVCGPFTGFEGQTMEFASFYDTGAPGEDTLLDPVLIQRVRVNVADVDNATDNATE